MPFTAQQFFEVFGPYHAALWPAPVFLNALAVLALVLAWRGKAHDTLSSRAGHAAFTHPCATTPYIGGAVERRT